MGGIFLSPRIYKKKLDYCTHKINEKKFSTRSRLLEIIKVLKTLMWHMSREPMKKMSPLKKKSNV